MIFNFKDLYNELIYEKSNVVFVFGRYTTFNIFVIDKLMDTCRVSMQTDISEDLLEFGIEDDSVNGISNVPFSTFLDVIGAESITGRWFCSCDLKSINRDNKQKEALKKYIRDSSSNGLLVISSYDYMEYREWLKLNSIRNSRDCHIIQLSFPDRDTTVHVVQDILGKYGIKARASAVEYAVMQLDRNWDKLDVVLDTIKKKHGTSKSEITEQDMKGYLKGVQYFSVDTFVDKLAQSVSNKNAGKKTIYKMEEKLIETTGSAEELCRRVLRDVRELKKYRIYVNDGYATPYVEYFMSDTLELMGEEGEQYKQTSEYTFKRKLRRSANTSLRDWQFIDNALSKALSTGFSNSDEREKACSRALYSVINRRVFDISRITDQLGYTNVFDDELKKLDGISYADRVKTR